MLLSIIIPTYNLGESVVTSIASLEEQGLAADEFEVLVIDDGSTDNTVAVVNAFVLDTTISVRVFKMPHAGVSVARNHGIDHANGEYIYFLDGDDFLSSNFLTVIKEVIERDRPDLIVTSYNKVSNGKTLNVFRNDFDKDRTFEFKMAYLKGNVALNMCTFVFSASIIREKGFRFTAFTRYGEDIEFYQTYLFCSDSVVAAPDAVFNYVARPNSVSSQRAGLQREQAILGLLRVQQRLIERKIRPELLKCHLKVFIPNHVLKVISNLAEHGQYKEAIQVANKYRNLLAVAESNPRSRFKAFLCAKSPLAFIWLLRAIRSMRGSSIR